jgi:transposase
MAYRYGQDRDQQMLFPPSLDEIVAADHPVRAYDVFVDSLDLEALGIEADERKVGNSRYHPRLMLKLLVYGYSYGVMSSRKLEREIHNNISFIWLMRNLKPDHKTIAEFRRHNRDALGEVLKRCAVICLKLGLVEGNILFVDSTKLKANAGAGYNHTQKSYRKQLAALERRIADLLSEIDRLEEQEAGLDSLVKMKAELANTDCLKAKVNRALAEFEERGARNKNGQERKINRIDPESGYMKGRFGTHAGYSVQTVVDDKHGLIVQTEAVHDGNDRRQLSRQVEEAESTLGRVCKSACADSGYSNVDEYEKVETETRMAIVPTPQQVSGKEPPPFDRTRFTYDEAQDCYLCPLGHRLIFRGLQDRGRRRKYRIEHPGICRACPHYGQCTEAKQGRSIIRHRSEKLKEHVEKRFEQPEVLAIYKRRKSRVELPFGFMKKVLGFNQFNLRGRGGAQAEASLLSVCFNITRMMTILGGVRGFIAGMASI